MLWTIDFEASSLWGDSYPIEAGISCGDRTYSWLIRRESDWTDLDWSNESAAIHNITKEMLESEGLAANYVAEELNRILKNGIVYCDGGIYDAWWCSKLYEAANIEKTWRLFNYKVLPHYKDKNVITKHRAGEDALQLWKDISNEQRMRGQ